MEFFCRHCDDIVSGDMYRVLSEENGVVLLDMIVCRSCYEQARKLGLKGSKIRSVSRFSLADLSALRSTIARHRSDRAL